jgi:hypothetical protein
MEKQEYLDRIKEIDDLTSLIGTYGSKGFSEEELLKVIESCKNINDAFSFTLSGVLVINNGIFLYSLLEGLSSNNLNQIKIIIPIIIVNSFINGNIFNKYLEVRKDLKGDYKRIRRFCNTKVKNFKYDIELLNSYDEELRYLKLKLNDEKTKNLVKK